MEHPTVSDLFQCKQTKALSSKSSGRVRFFDSGQFCFRTSNEFRLDTVVPLNYIIITFVWRKLNILRKRNVLFFAFSWQFVFRDDLVETGFTLDRPITYRPISFSVVFIRFEINWFFRAQSRPTAIPICLRYRLIGMRSASDILRHFKFTVIFGDSVNIIFALISD